MRSTHLLATLAVVSCILPSTGTNQLFGQFDINWYTIDGGGDYSANGNFELNGTIGQHDAGPTMTGGSFSVTGGFWTSTPGSILLGDVNGDGVVNLLDVAPFIDAVSNGVYIPEADINGDGVVNLLDVQPFVDLLSGG